MDLSEALTWCGYTYLAYRRSSFTQAKAIFEDLSRTLELDPLVKVLVCNGQVPSKLSCFMQAGRRLALCILYAGPCSKRTRSRCHRGGFLFISLPRMCAPVSVNVSFQSDTALLVRSPSRGLITAVLASVSRRFKSLQNSTI